jgi:hypothetical protein
MSLSVGIIQSNYLPWRGYFDLIDDVDLFIVYDHVQYTKHDWRNRNRIKTGSGPAWISVPVRFSLSAPTPIDRTPVVYNANWQKKHTRSIDMAYRSSPYYQLYQQDLLDIINTRFETISELNVNLIQWIMRQLRIETPIRFSREFSPTGNKTDMLIETLKQVGATDYLCGPASRAYLETKKFRAAGIRVEYKSYDYQDYPQLHGPFEPNISVIDLLFNCGPDARRHLKSLSPNLKAAGT